MKVSFIATVYNEEASVGELLKSLIRQSEKPDEIIIVDGGSTDNTLSVISNCKSQIANDQIKFKFIVKKGNRAVGRNEAIKNASNEIIVCSDTGCVLDKNWIRNIVKPFNSSNVDVVAGYYKGNAKNIFEKCLIPYVLVMSDKVNENNFLPATRSIAFRKSTWRKTGGFPEEFSNNEDYVFAKRLVKINANIVFEKKAIAYWTPRGNLKETFTMFYRFAKGDCESRIFRPKVILIFLRYIIGFALLFLFFVSKSYVILNALYLILLAYILWSMLKNYKYVKDTRAIFYLPLIQITSDVAVILGTINGLLTDRLRIVVEGTFYTLIVYAIILLNFRQLRSFFSPPKAIEGDIVGFAQYYGYSLYFETIIFLVFVLSPIVVFFILSGVRK